MSYRFAPSPSGALHLGNARIAAFNALAAAKEGAPLILRLDDTDAARSSEAAVDAIIEDLRWLGIEFDKRVRQSERRAVAAELFAELKAVGRVYECFESEEELAALRKAAASQNKPPLYPRTALGLSAAQKTKLRGEAAGYWRFKLSDHRFSWQDEVFGEITTDLASISDPVVVNQRGRHLFLLAGIADDLEMGIGKIIRGADHLNGSAVQLDICAAVGKTPPKTAHLPLVSGTNRKPLSKRESAELSLAGLRKKGFEPLGLLNFMVFWGAAYPDSAPSYEQGELARRFTIANTAKASLTADPLLLGRYNRNFIRKMPFAMAKQRSAGLGEAVWRAVSPNIDGFGEVKRWQRIFTVGWKPPKAAAADKKLLRRAAELLADAADFHDWSKKLTAATALHGRKLLAPIRLALTGLDKGASMGEIYDILGKEEMAKRLEASA